MEKLEKQLFCSAGNAKEICYRLDPNGDRGFSPLCDNIWSIILFIDEVHTLIGAGSGGQALDAANIMKPNLARGELLIAFEF
ncbi:hypothetical protein Pint_06369 [Pistacia integerrima]|uniref:Uncharacterized protein n=1 Tax=Pistacia integerrima TaxID=434235 RepID=A0ACC0Z4D3_9ROSI|nr:hypothetical protein Pint_06369 [Pistacia integerrima]